MRTSVGHPAIPTLIAMSAVLATAGCAEGSSFEDPAAEGQSYSQRLESYLEEAESGGASETQIGNLREAHEEGEVPYETMRAAIQRAVECMTEAGLDASIVDETRASGLEIPMYRASHGDEVDSKTGWEMIRTCEESESYWLSAAYQQQPRARELLVGFVQSKEDELRECLKENGVETDDNSDGWDLATRALEHMGAEQDGFDCLSAVGIDGL